MPGSLSPREPTGSLPFGHRPNPGTRYPPRLPRAPKGHKRRSPGKRGRPTPPRGAPLSDAIRRRAPGRHHWGYSRATAPSLLAYLGERHQPTASRARTRPRVVGFPPGKSRMFPMHRILRTIGPLTGPRRFLHCDSRFDPRSAMRRHLFGRATTTRRQRARPEPSAPPAEPPAPPPDPGHGSRAVVGHGTLRAGGSLPSLLR